ncbi:hypothetical protein PGT21_003965 [Puccinia graminis f. sp. tritici]|uniref:Uncharacterized protein n=1 Tax=Puccinia graminis f. sp. tritici TaxID=56615 RepID=A0A5B0NCY8_PUCGR|nr:hypothetical protein PGT21_003965 [Puccinia graminis f. sp. tritici]
MYIIVVFGYRSQEKAMFSRKPWQETGPRAKESASSHNLREGVFATGFRFVSGSPPPTDGRRIRERLNDRRQSSKVFYRFVIAVRLIWITSRMAWFVLSLITREPLACEPSLNINGSSRTGRGHAVSGSNR